MQNDANKHKKKKNGTRILLLVAFLSGIAVQYVGTRLLPFFVVKIQGYTSADLAYTNVRIIQGCMRSFFEEYHRYPTNWQELYAFEPALGSLPPLYRDLEYVLSGGSNLESPLVYESQPYVYREAFYVAGLPTGETVFLLPEELQEMVEAEQEKKKQ